MKKITFALLLSVTILSSCNGVTEQTEVNSTDSTSVSIDSTTTLEVDSTTTLEVDSNLVK